MADTQHAEAHGDHHPTSLEKTYLIVFGALCVGTSVSFVAKDWPGGANLIMLVAVIKATLVAMFFMHLKYDWFKLYYMIVPTLVMGLVLICMLLPDMTFSNTRLIAEDLEQGKEPFALAYPLEKR